MTATDDTARVRHSHHTHHSVHNHHSVVRRALSAVSHTVSGMCRAVSRALRRGFIAAIRWYQRVISPGFPARCKYYPTCSAYALTAIERFGVFRGGALAVARLLRCQPWNNGGIDDVPATFSLFYRFRWSRAYQGEDAQQSARESVGESVCEPAQQSAPGMVNDSASS